MLITPTSQEISDYCRISGDANVLHNPDYMHERGKEPIVPGMLTLLWALSQVNQNWLLNKAQGLDCYFNAPLSVGYRAIIQASPMGEYYKISADSDRQALETKDSESIVSKDSMPIPYHTDLPTAQELPDVDLETFSRITLLEGNPANFFYALSLSSNPLLHTVESLTGINLHLKEMFDDKIPVYTRIKGSFPGGVKADVSQPLGFTVGLIQTNLDNRPFADLIVHCTQNSMPLYTVQSRLVPLSEAVVLRMAKDTIQS